MTFQVHDHVFCHAVHGTYISTIIDCTIQCMSHCYIMDCMAHWYTVQCTYIQYNARHIVSFSIVDSMTHCSNTQMHGVLFYCTIEQCFNTQYCIVLKLIFKMICKEFFLDMSDVQFKN